MNKRKAFFDVVSRGAAVVMLAATTAFAGNAAAQSTAPAASQVEGWIYLGRLDGAKKKWVPKSAAVAGMLVPARGTAITIATDSVLVGDIEKNVNSPEVSRGSDPLALAPAGTRTRVLSVRDFPSAGKGTYRWAKVKVRPTYRTT